MLTNRDKIDIIMKIITGKMQKNFCYLNAAIFSENDDSKFKRDHFSQDIFLFENSSAYFF